MTDVDLFAGAGGWDLGGRRIGLDVMGIESDVVVCATRRLSRLATVNADVAALDPREFPCDGLIGSPPCQGWSRGGKGDGRGDLDLIIRCLLDLGDGKDTRAELAAECADPRSILVAEPLRWALAIRPRWVALEQVESVAPAYAATAMMLQQAGYSAWTGMLSAERYGVPQTRSRCYLIARLDGPAVPPPPTHQRYIAPRGENAPDPVVHRDDHGLLPWVSMADALGWDPQEEVGFQRARNAGYGSRDLRPAGEPSFVVTGKARSWTRRRPAPTVATTRGGVGGRRTDGQHINLTIQEAGTLQTFPQDFVFQGTRTQQFQQVGNAVPPLMAERVLEAAAGPALQVAA